MVASCKKTLDTYFSKEDADNRVFKDKIVVPIQSGHEFVFSFVSRVEMKKDRHLDLAFTRRVDMRHQFDFSPLYRSVVGFDRLANLLETAQRSEAPSNWPPYNIEAVGEDAYRIEIAVAGFSPSELFLEAGENLLTVSGKKTPQVEADGTGRTYLHRGLAERGFERRFQLADYVVVTDASLENGLLSVNLRRELPEALKPRSIEIRTGQAPGAGVIDADAKLSLVSETAA